MTTRDEDGPVEAAVADAATRGSYCPKMCTFACPVVAATGRDDAVPWSFHRTVSDLATGRRQPDESVSRALEACTGCLACRDACLFDQDVPAQVREGRAALRRAGVADPAVGRAVERVRSGRSPYGTPLPEPVPADGATVTLVAGCRGAGSTVAAAVRLLEAAGEHPAVVVPPGCCGAALDDLGARPEARERRGRLARQLPATGEVVVADPHCLPAVRRVRPDQPTRDLPRALAERVAAGRLRWPSGSASGTVTYHDPCLLVRREEQVGSPRRLLAAAGLGIDEPEHHGRATRCSGAGLGMELLAPGAATATARRRADELDATGRTVVTACAGARRRLADAGLTVHRLAVVLAERLAEEP